MQENEKRRNLSSEQVLQKLKQFCAYQERSHQEVREKAFSIGLNNVDLQGLIATLIEENYLNEERFAIQYAGGKFRMKQWGRVKIKHALKQKQISEYCIKKALKQIDMDDYEKTLLKLAEQKEKLLSGTRHPLQRLMKLKTYLLGKGYEMDIINDVLKQRGQ